jgi:hypothetical protein
MDVLIGVLLVIAVAFHRFNTPPPPEKVLPPGNKIVGWIQLMFRREDERPDLDLFPPPRANTTLFKFVLYRLAYCATGVLVFLVVVKVPRLVDEIQEVFTVFGSWLGDTIPMISDAAPLTLSCVVAFLFPVLPPFRWLEQSLRRALYRRASIPAQQRALSARLKQAGFEVAEETLSHLRGKVEAEGFQPSDLEIDETPTTRSLWTKAAALLSKIAGWQAQDRYQTAFVVLKERDGVTRSSDSLKEVFEALKGDARACFQALREHPEEEETRGREAALREHTLQVLGRIYDLLSRVSLHSHYSERERVAAMRELGFQLENQRPPIPELNDLIWLGLLLGAMVVAPLWQWASPIRALMVAAILFCTVLTPILIASLRPGFASRLGHRVPAIAYPVVSGLIAAVASLTISVAVRSAESWSLVEGWESYWNEAYPWLLWIFLLAALLAFRARTGSYPQKVELLGLARYREWGDLRDAAILAVPTLLLFVVYIAPTLTHIAPDRVGGRVGFIVGLATLIAAVLGFVVPTWYRATRLGLGEEPELVAQDA